ncbi:hypothetical protein Celaphus_00010035 [Cervus elaphus hippelaphus]|uniref:Serine/arginine-rich splicing factor 2 n=1 Tax=Cervus elaphus hippelaphus TaxID=46360 RepID=A0A212C100_CEREH|nr:hypothetical protein Celaphus_00010035 [Cervus elaphus hippelaphus]
MSYSRPPPNVGDLISLKVDNLTDRISRRTLRRIFERYGPVGDVYIPRDRFTLESRGFAFVRFYDKHHAEEAMDALDGVMLDGRELWVQMARHGRLLDFHQGRRQKTPPQGQERQSHSLRLRRCRRSSTRSRSPCQARSRFSRSKSPSRSCDSSPSSSESRSFSATTSRFLLNVKVFNKRKEKFALPKRKEIGKSSERAGFPRLC